MRSCMPSAIRSPLPVRSPCSSRVREPRLTTASATEISLGITRRASLVARRMAGIATTTFTSGDHSQRTTRQRWEAALAVMQRPPSREGTTLSGWPSMSIASSSNFSRLRGSPIRALAPIRPATIAVALLPRPRAGGTPRRTRASIAMGCTPASFQTRWAARYTRLSGPPRRWEPSLPSMIRSKRSWSPSMLRNSKRLFSSSAAPRQSNPGPRLAVVAGTSTTTPSPMSGRTMKSFLLDSVSHPLGRPSGRCQGPGTPPAGHGLSNLGPMAGSGQQHPGPAGGAE